MEQSSSSLIETKISLARSTKAHRVIVAGDDSSAMYFELHRRGYVRLGTMATCRTPCGQFDVAFMTARDQSKDGLAASLGRLVHFLHATGVLVIQLGAPGAATNEQIRQTLDRLGFRIESGTCCGDGVIVCARRFRFSPVAAVEPALQRSPYGPIATPVQRAKQTKAA
jgi:hypothetical protein